MRYESLTATELAARIKRFQNRAKLIADQKHLDRILLSFPAEHHATVVAKMAGFVPAGLKLEASV